MRNPKRTSGTATALMVGVGVVTLFMVFGASLDASVRDTVARSLRADLVVKSDGFSGSGLSSELPGRIAPIPGVASVAALAQGSVVLDGKSVDVTTADPAALAGVLDLDARTGSIADLGSHELAVSSSFADDHRWTRGTIVTARFVDGTTQRLTVGAVYENAEIADDVLIPTATYTPHARQPQIGFVMIRTSPDADQAAVIRAVNRVDKALAAPDVMTSAQFVDDASGRIAAILTIVYVMLALSIVIALMGIANTLSLSIHERIRELGLLRAVGQVRSQTRAMVRWESVIISIFGTLAGVGIGLLMGWALVEGIGRQENGIGVFAAPVARLVTIVVIGGIVGVLAGFRPARRAARLEPLAAISTE
jgi:putative ABC transport system permease protein